MAETERPVLTPKAQWTAFIASFFSVAILPMTNLVVPLWALAIGASPFEIGMVMGSRSLLPFLFSIHAGALIDRLGTRRVMTVSALISAAMTVAYPALPWVGALIALQVTLGLVTTMGWIGAQTHIGTLTRGDPVIMGRFTSVTTFSNFLGPLLAGFAWDRLGAWGAFTLIALWAAAMLVAVQMLPDARLRETAEAPAPRSRARTLLPSFGDYLAALRLFAVPAVAVVMACSFTHNAALSMRFSFYVVYLESIAMPGTLIGFLVGLSSLVGAGTALLTGPATRLVPQRWLAVAMILVAICAISATPLAASFVPLFLLACVFGAGSGLGFTQIVSILSRIVPIGQLGMGIGLRTTVNRFSSLTVPVAMGAIIEGWSLTVSFFVMGALLACLILTVALALARMPPDARP